MIPQEIADAARGLVGHVGWEAYMAYIERRIEEVLRTGVSTDDTNELLKNTGRYEAYQSMVGWLERTIRAGEEATRNLAHSA